MALSATLGKNNKLNMFKLISWYTGKMFVS